jgi:hypothetical protein
MKTAFFLTAILILVLPVGGKAANNILEGCVDPDIIAEALSKLHNTNWRTLTLDQLQDIWPKELSYLECTPGGCKTVWSMDRIISGRCQCGALFNFTELLSSAFIYYASTQRSELITVAKKYGSALGIEEEDLKTMGQDATQYFFWEKENEVGGRNYHFEKEEQNWMFSIYIGKSLF